MNSVVRIENLFNRLAILVLVLNICVVSIPRCDSVFASIKHQLLHEAGNPEWDCGKRADATHKLATVQDDSLCRCSILKFLYFTMPDISMDRLIVCLRRLLLLIEFIEPDRLLSLSISPETPPPRPV